VFVDGTKIGGTKNAGFVFLRKIAREVHLQLDTLDHLCLVVIVHFLGDGDAVGRDVVLDAKGFYADTRAGAYGSKEKCERGRRGALTSRVCGLIGSDDLSVELGIYFFLAFKKNLHFHTLPGYFFSCKDNRTIGATLAV